MIYEVTINNKKYEVEVERGQATVINTVDVSEQANPLKTTQHGQAIPVVAAPPAASDIQATSSTSAPSSVLTPSAAPVPAPSAASATPDVVVSGKGETVKAPMPGTILDIKTNIGAKVRRGDILIILEAMKMENEIVAPVDGEVVQIQAVKGSFVKTGDFLAVIQ